MWRLQYIVKGKRLTRLRIVQWSLSFSYTDHDLFLVSPFDSDEEDKEVDDSTIVFLYNCFRVPFVPYEVVILIRRDLCLQSFDIINFYFSICVPTLLSYFIKSQLYLIIFLFSFSTFLSKIVWHNRVLYRLGKYIPFWKYRRSPLVNGNPSVRISRDPI